VLLEENNACATGALSRIGFRLIMLVLSLMIWLIVMVRLIGVKHLAEAMDNWLLVLVGYNSLTKKIFLADLRAEERAISRNL